VYAACGDACIQESGDDRNEGVDTITTSEVTCDNKCQKNHIITPGECQNKHVTSTRFTRGMTLLLRAWQNSCETKYNIYMLVMETRVRVSLIIPSATISLSIVFSVASASLTSTATFTIGFFVGLATSHVCP